MRATHGPQNRFQAPSSPQFLCISSNRGTGPSFLKGPLPQTHLQGTRGHRGPLVHCKAAPRSTNSSDLREWAQNAITTVGKGLISIGISSALLLAPLSIEAREVRFPASGDPEIFTVQKTLVEAWKIVRDSFVDGDGGRQWENLLGDSLMSAYESADGKDAYRAIQKMLSETGDPYTRIIPPEEYADFRVSSDGELQGVGLLIALDPSSGKLMVLSPIKGGPADRAGILPGDELLSIDGRSTEGLNGREAAKVLRGRNGTSVSVKFARRTEQIPGVPGTPEAMPKTNTKLVRLRREYVELSPVFYSKVTEAGEDLGYIKLTNFSNKAASDMDKAIKDLSKQGVEGFILDLRGNPGGLVNAGLDVARLWLEGSPTIFNVSGRGDETTNSISLPEGHARTELPLVVVVNQDSASASEILAGALQDNHRATVVGDRTYGKGKIQTVFELDDGSALFVTVARYKTPSNHDIDLIGIKPDMACSPNMVGPAPVGEGDGVRGPRSLKEKTLLEADLEMDDCFLTAERFLYKNSRHI